MSYIANPCINHVMHVDDLCLMAPSPASLQDLIDIGLCYNVNVQNKYDSFNSSKSY